MRDERECSNIKLVSNIMIKSKYEKEPMRYLPADLLPASYVDSRAQGTLTMAQREQFEKRLFYAKRIVDR